MQKHEWVALTTVFGGGTSNPSNEDMSAALAELFANPDDEHPDAWISCGSTNGPLYSISVFSSGFAIYSKYSDSDMSEEIESFRIPDVDAKTALALWSDLIDGCVPTVP